MDSSTNTPLRIGGWNVDPMRAEISREGTVVRLQPRAMGLLVCLARHAGEVVSIEDLLAEVWTGVIVTPDSVYQCVGTLRESLGDDPRKPSYIATVPRLGYRLIASVGPASEPPTRLTAPLSSTPPPAVSANRDPPSVPPPAGKRFTTSASAVAAILLCLAAFVVYRLIDRTSAPAATSPAVSTTPSPEPSVAVLPFLDMSESKDQQYFADGMTEEMIDLLSKIPTLKVPARTSSFYFKGKQTTVAEIGKLLGVANVLEGSVRKSGNTLRITAQLIRSDTGFHLWSETYDRPLDDIFKVQDDIAGEISKKLKASLGEGPLPRSTVSKNPEAYVWYLKALTMRHGFRTQEAAATIVEYLNKSIESDPTYAPAWAELARALVYQSNSVYALPTAIAVQAHTAAERALDLDPQLAAALVAAGVVHEFIDWDLTAAERDYRRGLDLAPNWPDVLNFLGSVTENLGRLVEARGFYERANALDPLDERYYENFGDVDFLLGQLDKAENEFRTALALNPQLPDSYWDISFCRLAKGDFPGALAMAGKNPDEPTRLWNLAVVYSGIGRMAESNQALSELEKKYADGWAYQVAESYAYRGDTDRAFAWLDRAYRQRDGGIEHVKIDWQLKRLHGDPRYRAFLRKIHLPE
jgi:TolB-like protein/DNA-binding winged helix-turn-helix (wHTH) protein/tetratricopeptide (TPR) repeat protein